MPVKRILIVQSVNHFPVPRSKIEVEFIKNHRLSEGYIVENFYTLNEAFDPPKNITVGQLFERIAKAVNSFRPHVIFLHTGLAFHLYPKAFRSAFIKLKKHYPSIRFGIENFSNMPKEFENLGIFENSIEMRKIEDRFF